MGNKKEFEKHISRQIVLLALFPSRNSPSSSLLIEFTFIFRFSSRKEGKFVFVFQFARFAYTKNSSLSGI